MSENRFIPWKWVQDQKNVPHSFEEFQRQLNDLLEVMWTKIGTQHHGVSGRAYSPRSDLGESAKALEIRMDLPGVEEKDIEIRVSDDNIIIQGEKKSEYEEKGWNYHLSERAYGSFHRTFSLPPGADADKTKASFENGVLTIAIPKKAGSQKPGKSIPIGAKTKPKPKSKSGKKPRS